VVLDLRLGSEDGMVLARRLREKSAIPIILLTDVHDEADRIMGLELDADDYLTKPFSPRELLARVRTVLRRTKGEALTQTKQSDIRAYRFASFELNIRTRRLQLTGRSSLLTVAARALANCGSFQRGNYPNSFVGADTDRAAYRRVDIRDLRAVTHAFANETASDQLVRCILTKR
jgi:response regulator RpfG family c-di-GMP phosphodiesterase